MKTLKTAFIILSLTFASASFAGRSMKDHNSDASCTGKTHQVGLNTQTAYVPPKPRERTNPRAGQYDATRGQSRSGSGYTTNL
ncbi:MAG: hypothetical protein HRT45_18090 [Bdellovibrionales bacterium]|nr:hypothetical protein [Bdellovibrionales bacterium]